MGINIETLVAAKKFTSETVLGGGAVVGKNVTISSIAPIDGGNRITFSYTLDNGTTKTSTLDVMNGVNGTDGKDGIGVKGDPGTNGSDGADGIGIASVTKTKTEGLVDTYTITFTDGSTFNYDVTNGKNGKDGSGSSIGEENVIESIKVNGVAQTVAEDKSVDITVPTVDVDKNYVDIELAKKANTSDIPSLDGYVTDEELIAKGYLTSHQDISSKVDKVNGKSLIADTEIERLKSVKNYDDTEIKTELAKKANSTDVTKEISDKIAEVISDAPESFDTLKEISDWISGHENDASAMNSAIKDNKSAITTLQTDKANKTEIPTELPANGGNSATVNGHTVKSDVPENAVFTDTVYDYSSLLGYDIYNLVSMKDATYPANKTWLSKDFIAPFDGHVFFMVQTDATSGAFTQVLREDDVLVSNNQRNIADFNTWGEAYNHPIYKGKTYHFKSYNNTATAFNKVMLCIRKKLETPTEYVPYAPSNVELAKEKADKSETTVNLLNPTLETTTQNGVTCTNNGDGTYTLNGTANANTWFTIETGIVLDGTYKIIAFSNPTRNCYAYIGDTKQYFTDYDKPINTVTLENQPFVIQVLSGGTLSNVIVKPMITTNLDATYADFVPYTGGSGSLNGNVAEIKNDLGASNAGAHNSVYRGKYLGDSLTTEQKAQILAGTFNDLYIGDYWTIGEVNYRIAAFDYWLNSGDTKCTTHHVVIAPDSNLYTVNMNDTNITTGAYVGSKMYTENLAQAKTTITNAFGSENILSHREYLANATKSTTDPTYESAGSWYDSTVELMNERMVYGADVFHNIEVNGAIPMNYTINKSQLPLFALEPSRICNRADWWLRDVVSAACFAHVNITGNAHYNTASDYIGVRPAFAIKG